MRRSIPRDPSRRYPLNQLILQDIERGVSLIEKDIEYWNVPPDDQFCMLEARVFGVERYRADIAKLRADPVYLDRAISEMVLGAHGLLDEHYSPEYPRVSCCRP